MLLQHGWLAPLDKPATISEEDEALVEDLGALVLVDGNDDAATGIAGNNTFDKEVSDWCVAALERKRSGQMGTAAKPALHAAPLDSVSPAASPAAVT
jgi:mitogen-activated protein kinase kinase